MGTLCPFSTKCTALPWLLKQQSFPSRNWYRITGAVKIISGRRSYSELSGGAVVVRFCHQILTVMEEANFHLFIFRDNASTHKTKGGIN